MATTIAEAPTGSSASDRPRGGSRPPTSRSRLAEWRAGWRVALRLAVRDTAAHRGRSALVLVMIALPVLLMVAALTGYATKDVHGQEAIPGLMGRAAGVVESVQDQAYAPSATGEMTFTCSASSTSCEPPPAKHLPGLRGSNSAAPAADMGAAVGRLLDARVLPFSTGPSRVTVGDTRRGFNTLVIDGRDPLVRGMADLVSDRWPTTRDEVVVTESGMSRGLPSSGTLQAGAITHGPDGAQQSHATSVTIVGVAAALVGEGSSAPISSACRTRRHRSSSPAWSTGPRRSTGPRSPG
ncbi:hypothetical protein MM440_15700 [Arsenicicoccus piscis]|uniref:ABC transporter permease n=1 Tax=Arsenicicoccus piscis TaxID=673954 RepID=A0ABQ6HPD0_9MICO|nr:hypothetical protein [Arsenicicoccus piscis]MCH8629177.1 hypothetical protein [Arsenicicoccus piscis]GMA20256.1 hypothetical protein GCM10025862_22770 [Arsenicicoccus piscis]